MTAPTAIGQIEGREVHAVTLKSDGLSLKLLTWGARLAELWVPDRQGTLADIVLGQDSMENWQTHGTYIGATCGRYGNRIAGGRFTLDGRVVQLDQNESAQHLHGGSKGLDLKVWDIESQSDRHVTFTTTSPDGDMGYPGTLTARTTYRIDQGLQIEMEATTDAPTIVNLVNHAYFNLAGHGSGDILGQQLQVEAGFYLPVDDRLIPTGEVLTVTGTPFDFRATRPIGQDLPGQGGFDHNLCLSGPLGTNGLRRCLQAYDPASGRRMRLSTTEPGLQFYTGAHFDQTPGKGGARYPRFAGFAAETQRFPDSPNRPQFPSARLDPGYRYRHVMHFDFSPA
ncbi:aldose epimerase family protein [Tabrizicola sp.]|uniref:aldose epimerase family protein n=1 Tax=Tabrizicola sp. TaxID=2005166 RepID=UPI002735E631|nr:aldose epimerase family protein [Tabrizicola sp.]MDP3197396.1 aldose epimerase family protein [Tabrizicola sp.]